uniref:hypothetical protein n=1 Tax=Streptococcus mutans TaxID=1309 RepID=UPI001C3FDA85
MRNKIFMTLIVVFRNNYHYRRWVGSLAYIPKKSTFEGRFFRYLTSAPIFSVRALVIFSMYLATSSSVRL